MADAPRQANRSRRILILLIKLAIAAVLLVILFRTMEWSAFRDAFGGIRWPWFVVAALLHFPGYLISAWRWRLLLVAQDQRIPFWKLVESYIVATFFNYTMLGTLGGDFVRMADTGLGRKRGAQAASSVFVERLTGLAAMMFIAALGVVLLAATGGGSASLHLMVWGALVLFALFCAALYLLTHPRTIERLARWLDRPWPLFGAARRILLKLGEALAVFRGNRRPVYANLAWAVLLQVNVVAHYYCLGLAMGLPLLTSDPLRHVFSYMVLVPFITLILMIPLTPGGAGVREWTLRGLRRGLGFSLAGGAEAVMMGWLQVGSALLYGLAGVLIFIGRSFRAGRTRPE